MQKEVYCWGAGHYAEESFNDLSYYIKMLNYELRGFIDKNDNLVENKKTFMGYPLISLSKLDNIEKESIIIITSIYFKDIFNLCVNKEIEEKRIMFWDNINKLLLEVTNKFSNKFYSNCGEDIYLKRRFKNISNGFYVDVGAYHPHICSNTYWAYCKGWNGINIEPNKDRYVLFEKARNRDINLNCGISEKSDILNYYMYSNDTCNSFYDEKQRNRLNGKPINVENVEVKPLREIFERYNIKKIDFIDIDVEGFELEVLKSIDFSKVNIECILLEQLPLCKGYYSINDIIESEEYKLLKEYGYYISNKYDSTVIYEKKSNTL